MVERYLAKVEIGVRFPVSALLRLFTSFTSFEVHGTRKGTTRGWVTEGEVALRSFSGVGHTLGNALYLHFAGRECENIRRVYKRLEKTRRPSQTRRSEYNKGIQ